ncbi:ArtI protein, partial [Pseudomonas sp. PA-4-8C]|nr:ArtI protein [Pseudomonas sp. PA-4-8C]
MKAPLALCVLASLANVAQADTAASRLDEVIARGTLTVCTTGDYKPYTSLRS